MATRPSQTLNHKQLNKITIHQTVSLLLNHVTHTVRGALDYNLVTLLS